MSYFLKYNIQYPTHVSTRRWYSKKTKNIIVHIAGPDNDDDTKELKRSLQLGPIKVKAINDSLL